MHTIILDHIAFQIDRERLRYEVCPGHDPDDLACHKHLTDHTETLGKPKGLYRVSLVGSRGEDWANESIDHGPATAAGPAGLFHSKETSRPNVLFLEYDNLEAVP